MQIVFQDPYASLNPRMTVRNIISEPLAIHDLYTGRRTRKKRVDELLRTAVAAERLVRAPIHEESRGGRRRDQQNDEHRECFFHRDRRSR